MPHISQKERIRQGNYVKGSDVPGSRLTAERVGIIRSQLSEADQLRARLQSLTCAAIAEREGVSEVSIKNIKQGITWRHI